MKRFIRGWISWQLLLWSIPILCLGCSSLFTDAKVVEDSDTSDTDTNTDKSADTNMNLVPAMGMPSGGGIVSSTNYKVKVSAGGVSPAGTAQSTSYRVDLGVGSQVNQ